MVGPLVGLGLYEAFHHRIRPLLMVAVIPAVASVALVGALRDTSRRWIDAELAPPEPATPVPAEVRRLIAALAVFGLFNFPDALLLRARALGLSVAGVIGAYVVYNPAYALASTDSSADLLRDLKRRGMRAPMVAVGDGALGFWAALRTVWLETTEARCWVHKVANCLNALPKSVVEQTQELKDGTLPVGEPKVTPVGAPSPSPSHRR